MYSVVNNFWDEVTDVSVRITMKGEKRYFEEDDLLIDLFDTFDLEMDDDIDIDF